MGDKNIRTGQDWEPAEIDTSEAHVARVYDYLLNGKVNFAVDRRATEEAYAAWPGGLDGVRADAHAHRAALGRMVRYLASEAGIHQFLDIGSGIPRQNNVHEVAQHVAPEARIVYVDYDPIVLAHAHGLLKGTPAGSVAYLCRDLRDIGGILDDAAQTLDFTKPTAIILFGVLHFFANEENPRDIVTRLADALAPGSYLAISHLARTPELEATFERLNENMSESVILRNQPEVADLFGDLDPIEPGLVELPQWRPDAQTADAGPLPMWCGLARKQDPAQEAAARPQ